jgi:hypothetical protein
MGINLGHDGQSGQQRSATYPLVSLPFGRGCWLYNITFSPAHAVYSVLSVFRGANLS